MGRLFCALLAWLCPLWAFAQSAPGVVATQEDIGSLGLVRTGDDGSVCYGHFGSTVICLFPDWTNAFVDGALMGDITVRLSGLRDLAVIDASEVLAADRTTGSVWRLDDAGTSTQITAPGQFPQIWSAALGPGGVLAVTEERAPGQCAAWVLTDTNGDGQYQGAEISCLLAPNALASGSPRRILLTATAPLAGFLLTSEGRLLIAADADSDGEWSAGELAPYAQLGPIGIDVLGDGSGQLHGLSEDGAGTFTVTLLGPDADGNGLPDRRSDVFTTDARSLTSLALTDPLAAFQPYVDGGSNLYLEDSSGGTDVTMLAADTSITPTPGPTATPAPSPSTTPTPTPSPTLTSTVTPTPTVTPASTLTPTPTLSPLPDARILLAGWATTDLDQQSGGAVEIAVLSQGADAIGVWDGAEASPLSPSISTSGDFDFFQYGPFSLPAGSLPAEALVSLVPLGTSTFLDGTTWPYLNVHP